MTCATNKPLRQNNLYPHHSCYVVCSASSNDCSLLSCLTFTFTLGNEIINLTKRRLKWNLTSLVELSHILLPTEKTQYVSHLDDLWDNLNPNIKVFCTYHYAVTGDHVVPLCFFNLAGHSINIPANVDVSNLRLFDSGLFTEVDSLEADFT